MWVFPQLPVMIQGYDHFITTFIIYSIYIKYKNLTGIQVFKNHKI